ncbi:MAG: hypothetical protein ACX939_03680 [Hyphococcus sp.]
MITVSLHRLRTFVIVASLFIILIGVGREIYLALLGHETPLRHLRHFQMNAENTAIVWYSSALMLLNACLLYLISGLAAGAAHQSVFQWRLLAVVFVLLSIDETASFHESAIGPMYEVFGLTGYFTFGWVIPAALLLALFVIFYAPFLRKLPRRTAGLFILAGAIYVGGAMGLEMVSGKVLPLGGREGGLYVLITAIEEVMEIVGLTVFFVALAGHFFRETGRWSVRIAPAAPEAGGAA